MGLISSTILLTPSPPQVCHFVAIKFRLMTTDVMLFPIFVRQGRSRRRFKVGYINQTGNVVIDPKFDDGTNFYEQLASVKVGNRWSIINFAGDFLIQSSKWGWCRFHEGLASISVKGKWGIIDRRGEFVVTPRYEYIGPYRDGLALFGLGEGNHRRYGFLNKNGSEVIPPVFHDAKEFSEGLAAARVGDLWGYNLTAQEKGNAGRTLALVDLWKALLQYGSAKINTGLSILRESSRLTVPSMTPIVFVKVVL
jgi:hypothetical protein